MLTLVVAGRTRRAAAAAPPTDFWRYENLVDLGGSVRGVGGRLSPLLSFSSPTNPVTLGVFLTACQRSSSRSSWART